MKIKGRKHHHVIQMSVFTIKCSKISVYVILYLLRMSVSCSVNIHQQATCSFINTGIISHPLSKQRKTLHTISETPTIPPQKKHPREVQLATENL